MLTVNPCGVLYAHNTFNFVSSNVSLLVTRVPAEAKQNQLDSSHGLSNIA